MNANPPLETLSGSEEQAPLSEREQEQQLPPQPEPVPPLPIRPLASTKAECERALSRFKAFVERFESDQKRLEEATREENEILDSGGNASEQEQLERLTRTLALKKVLERKLERGWESGRPEVAGQLESAAREAVRSLWQELALLRAKREEKHPATLKKLVGNEQQWPWALELAKRLLWHFADIRIIDNLGAQADDTLSHGAVELAAEQVLADIGTFEGEKAAKTLAAHSG